MNIALLVVVVIFVIFAGMGWKKGIIRTAVSLVSLVISLLAGVVLTPVVTQYIKQNTEIYSSVEKGVYEVMLNSKDLEEAVDEEMGEESADVDKAEQIMEQDESGIINIAKEISQKMGLPDSLVDGIKSIEKNEILENVIQTGEVTVKNIVAAVVAASIAGIILKLTVYAILFFVTWVVLRIIVGVTDLISRLPVISQINKAAGLCLGIAEGLVIVWVMFAVVTACGTSEWAATMLIDIGNSGLLSFLYNNNLILKFIGI